MITEKILDTLAKQFVTLLLSRWIKDFEAPIKLENPTVDSFFKAIPELREKERQIIRLLSRLEESWSNSVTEGLDERVFTPDRVDMVICSLQAGYTKLICDQQRIAELGIDSEAIKNEIIKYCTDDIATFSKDELEVFHHFNNGTTAHIFGLVNQLPNFQTSVLKEILHRENEIIDKLNSIIETTSIRLSEEKSDGNVNAKYLSLIDAKFSQCQIFGLDVSFSDFDLDLTYTNLRVRSANSSQPDDSNKDILTHLKENNLIVVLGNPGAGKTTLLQWLTVTQARRSGKDSHEWLNNYVPFYIRLRNIEDKLPALSEWPEMISSVLASPSNEKWVVSLAKNGKAFIMLDGYDEINDEKRKTIATWINDLILTYPKIKIILTSRHAAFKTKLLAKNDPCIIEIQPMNTDEIKRLSEKWFTAVSKRQDSPNLTHIEYIKNELEKRFINDPTLRNIASTPLLCTMICVLALERNAHLPTNKKDLYESAMSMLLERRDAERKISTFISGLSSKNDKQYILQEYAYWMVINNQHETDRECLNEVVKKCLNHYKFNNLSGKENEVTKYLIERSSLLREPGPNRVDFIHKTFEEFLAAKQLAENGDIGFLINLSSRSDAYEIICMAAMFLDKNGVNNLVEQLLKKSASEADGGYIQKLIAVSCKENTYHLNKNNDTTINGIINELMPPRDQRAIDAISACGNIAIPFLVKFKNGTSKTVMNCIKTLSQIASNEALDALCTFASSCNDETIGYIFDAWTCFDQDKFAKAVLPKVNCKKLIWPFSHTLNGIQYIASCHHIIIQDIERHEGIDLSQLNAIKNLNTLEIINQYDKNVVTINPQQSLENILIINCASLSIKITNNNTSVKSIKLTRVDNISDLSFIENFINLQSLEISDARSIKNISPIASNQKLSRIILDNVDHIKSMMPLSRLPLKELQVSNNAQIDMLPEHLKLIAI